MSDKPAAMVIDDQEARPDEWSTTLLERGTPNRPDGIAISQAISLKRIADALERIATADTTGITDAIQEGINRGAMDRVGQMARHGR